MLSLFHFSGSISNEEHFSGQLTPFACKDLKEKLVVLLLVFCYLYFPFSLFLPFVCSPSPRSFSFSFLSLFFYFFLSALFVLRRLPKSCPLMQIPLHFSLLIRGFAAEIPRRGKKQKQFLLTPEAKLSLKQWDTRNLSFWGCDMFRTSEESTNSLRLGHSGKEQEKKGNNGIVALFHFSVRACGSYMQSDLFR